MFAVFHLGRKRRQLHEILEVLHGIGMMLKDISARLETVVDLMEGSDVKENPTPRDPEFYLRLSEHPTAAREYMAEILARVETRMQERQARNERSFLRRFFAR